jgi:hypothetical protein
VTAGGPHYEPLVEMDFARARRFLDEHLMANTALTGATYDIDDGRQLLPRGREQWANGSGPTYSGST